MRPVPRHYPNCCALNKVVTWGSTGTQRGVHSPLIPTPAVMAVVRKPFGKDKRGYTNCR